MLFLHTEEELIASIYSQDGVYGLMATARRRQLDKRPLAAALALAEAIKKATVILEDNGKAILINLQDGNYSIFVWIPKYNTFVEFGLNGGIGYEGSMILNVLALDLIDAVDFLTAVESYKASDVIAFQKFMSAFNPRVPDLKRIFSLLR